METHESCQVRKEAALSGIFHVPWDRLDRAGDMGNAYVRLSEEGARHYIYNSTRPSIGRVFYCINLYSNVKTNELIENVIDINLWYNRSIMALYRRER